MNAWIALLPLLMAGPLPESDEAPPTAGAEAVGAEAGPRRTVAPAVSAAVLAAGPPEPVQAAWVRDEAAPPATASPSWRLDSLEALRFGRGRGPEAEVLRSTERQAGRGRWLRWQDEDGRSWVLGRRPDRHHEGLSPVRDTAYVLGQVQRLGEGEALGWMVERSERQWRLSLGWSWAWQGD